jgi:hypothetical protein
MALQNAGRAWFPGNYSSHFLEAGICAGVSFEMADKNCRYFTKLFELLSLSGSIKYWILRLAEST